ncbi:MAG TPA: TonB-dependent receptor [Vicinamibacterales bacterium]|nr:TonB-dependent receptor [Vicinamibacterales bacterium]
MKSFVRVGLVLFALAAPVLPAHAQTPNTGSIVVVVVDQTGGVVRDAKVTITNSATRASRDVMSGADGSVTLPALPLTGDYRISVTKAGFTADDVTGLTLRAGEIAQVKVKLVASGGKSEVTVFGTTQGVRADAQIGRRLDSATIDETPILGRKVTSLPLLNSAFRQGKGTGDLFVNATYFITGAGSRRTTTFMLDGSSNDESWGRQTAVITVPISAVQEATILTNAFNAEYGWTSGPAMNLVTKAGTNQLRGDVVSLTRPGDGFQSKSFSTKGYCPPSLTACTVPDGLASISPVDIPDELNQLSGSIGGAIVKDKTFFFAAADYTRQNRTTALSPTLPALVLENGSLEYVGRYRQKLVNARIDHKLTPTQTLMFRVNTDRMFDTNPNDQVINANAPSVARRYTRRGWSVQGSHTAALSSTLLNEARLVFTNGDPVTLWEPLKADAVYTRPTGGTSIPFTFGVNTYSNLYSRQVQFSDTASWFRGRHMFRLGGSVTRHMTGGQGTEPGQAVLPTFTFFATDPARNTLPLDQLTINDLRQYTLPLTYGAPVGYTLNQWLGAGFVQDSFRVNNDLTLDLGLRYDVQSITTARGNVAPRVGFGWHPNGDSRFAIRGGYGMYYTQIRTNSVAGYLQNGLDGQGGSYSVTRATTSDPLAGFPTCLAATPECRPAAATNANPANITRNVTLIAGKKDFYQAEFAKYGFDFGKIASLYPDEFLNPRSQVVSIGAERELVKGLFWGSDYVHQHWSNLDRSVDLNAPPPFDRTANGQIRNANDADFLRPLSAGKVQSAPGAALPAGSLQAVNTIMNLGVADYDGWQNQISYRGNPRMFAGVSYTLSKATNTSEPDGNGIGNNQANITRLGEEERGPSVVDQRHRAVITFTYNLPYNITVGTVTQLASGRPINATIGTDVDGDRANNDRPVINGKVVSRAAFRGTGTEDVALFVEGRIKRANRTVLLRLEGFNLLNHGNLLGRGVTTYGDVSAAPNSFGRFSAVAAGQTVAIPAFANIDPPRMFQVQIRYVF